MRDLQSRFPAARCELWCQDEHRLGLKPVLRFIWAPVGQRPRAEGWHRYQWTYLYGFCHPEEGQVYWLLLPTVSIPVYNQALAEFARDLGLGPQRRVLLAVDRAGWHHSAKVEVPEGLHLWFLPPYSPELQPSERLWAPVNEAIVNRSFATLEELQEAVLERCRRLSRQREFLKGLTLYHWWPREDPALCGN